MNEIDLFAPYGWLALIVYVLIREGFPLISNALPLVSRERTLRIQQEQLIREKREQTEQLAQAKREQRDERQTAALESISNVLAVSDERMSNIEKSLGSIESSLTIANTALAIILDRLGERLASSVAEAKKRVEEKSAKQ